jgi:hypothetical protein
MKTRIYIRSLIALLLLGSSVGCLLAPDSGSESGTTVEMVPYDPNNYTCSPLTDEDDNYLSSFYGVHGQLYYLDDTQPRYSDVNDYFTYGHHISNLDLFLSQVFIPTRPFDRGFVTQGGTTIQNEQGNTLYEYFALKLRGRLVKGTLPAGRYQVALLSDDGAVLNMDFGSGPQMVVDNNGQHPTRMGCAMSSIDLGSTPIPYELLYNQGPRFHIALTWMIRPWPVDDNPNDVQCGQQGNAMYFDSTQDPVVPMAAYNNLLARGWMPLRADNFLLPEDKIENPCSVPAPVISNFAVSNISSTEVTLTWTTDIASTSQVAFRLASSTTFYQTTELMNGSTQHSVAVTGLTPNTNYSFKAVSKSLSGQWSESTELAARTRR